MNNIQLDKYASEIAKEIVVAKAGNTTISMNAETGKNVADFYAEIFKGISETLKNSNILC